jgi:hypothetical protein
MHLYSVIEMRRSGSINSLGSEFDEFLLSPIGDDNNGMQLSVLSALARLDVDPWEQAATLARLPVDAATRKLAGMIASLPRGPSARSEPATIAARLVLLLPRRIESEVASRPSAPAVGTAARSPTFVYLALYILLMLLMLGVQWLAVSPQAPTQFNSVPSQPPPPASAH